MKNVFSCLSENNSLTFEQDMGQKNLKMPWIEYVNAAFCDPLITFMILVQRTV